jgi:ATP-binding cassette subfamily B protein
MQSESSAASGEKIMKTLKTILHYVRGFWKDTILTWFFVLLETICEILVVFFMQYLINDVNTSDVDSIYLFSILIAIIAVFGAVMGILAGIWSASAAAGFGKNLREAMYIQIQKYSFKNIDKFSTSSIITRTTTDVANVQNAFMQSIRAVIRAPFLIISALIMCAVTDWKLAWIFLLIIPFVLILLVFLASKVHPIFVRIFTTYDNLNQAVQEDVVAIRIVKAFDREDYEKKKFNGISDFIYTNFVHAEKVMAWNGPVVNFAVFGSIIAISYFGSEAIVSTNGVELSVGGLSTLITYVMLIMMALVWVSTVYVMIIIARNGAERIVEIIVEKPDIVSPQNALMSVPNGDVDFNHVSFAYVDDKKVLFDIDCHVKSGTMVGILGSTGSSKTTLVSLIARLYDPAEGSVCVGGHDVKEYNLSVLRDAVAVVLQKNTLFSGTIRQNLLWGDASASDETIMKACDLAQVTPFLKDMSQGLDTMVDEGGTNVSGGQKQRLCIARALLKNPKILILDDSTSACDTHTDALIREALQNERKDITKFIIAQRVLSVRNCDVIWVMNNGKIVAMGSSGELIESCPVYKELYDSQLGGGDFDARN